jgi:hypothetical protein
MIFDVRSLAAQKHKETEQNEVEWLRALESARQSLKFIDIDYQSLEQIALASRSPEKFTVVVRLIYQYGKSHPHGDQVSDLILEYTNDSPFSLSEWIDAIDFFYQWLSTNQRKIDFLEMLKYLQCCVVSPDARQGGQTFAALVEDMLNVSGYEG